MKALRREGDHVRCYLRGRGRKVRYFYYLLRVLNSFISVLQSVVLPSPLWFFVLEFLSTQTNSREDESQRGAAITGRMKGSKLKNHREQRLKWSVLPSIKDNERFKHLTLSVHRHYKSLLVHILHCLRRILYPSTATSGSGEKPSSEQNKARSREDYGKPLRVAQQSKARGGQPQRSASQSGSWPLAPTAPCLFGCDWFWLKKKKRFGVIWWSVLHRSL